MTSYLVGVLSYVAIWGVLSLGLDIQWGWAGLVNLAYFMFAAVGAYMYAVLRMGSVDAPHILGYEWSFIPAVIVATAAAGLVAWAVGVIVIRRLRPEYFVIGTLTIAAMVYQVVSQYQGLWGGASGLFEVPGPIKAESSSPSYPYILLGVLAVCLALAYGVAQRTRRSNFGLLLRAARDRPEAVAAFGRDPVALKLKAFVLGGAFAGFGGTLLASYLTAFNPGVWSVPETLILFVAVLMGGRGRPAGVMIGVVVVGGVLQQTVQLLPTLNSMPDLIPSLEFVVIGAAMIVLLRIRPQGIMIDRPRALAKSVGNWEPAPIHLSSSSAAADGDDVPTPTGTDARDSGAAVARGGSRGGIA